MANSSHSYPDVTHTRVGQVVDLYHHRRVITKEDKQAPYVHNPNARLDLAFAKQFTAEELAA